MYKLYLIQENGKYGTVKFKSSNPKARPTYYIGEVFEGSDSTDIDVYDVVDDGQGGKKAVFNQSKADAKEAANDLKKSSKDQKAAAKQVLRQKLQDEDMSKLTTVAKMRSFIEELRDLILKE